MPKQAPAQARLFALALALGPKPKGFKHGFRVLVALADLTGC